jgi:hypothetical protein
LQLKENPKNQANKIKVQKRRAQKERSPTPKSWKTLERKIQRKTKQGLTKVVGRRIPGPKISKYWRGKIRMMHQSHGSRATRLASKSQLLLLKQDMGVVICTNSSTNRFTEHKSD